MINNLFFPENRAVYELEWKNIVEADEPQIIWRMRFACWIHKVTNTHSEYETLLAFSLQQWLQEGPSMLHVHCLSCVSYSTYAKSMVTAD
jgi:hypothetical protein